MNAIPYNVETHLLQIFSILSTMSSENYLVGGCVRDLLMGRQPKDYDVITTMQIEKLIPSFENNGWKTSVSGQLFKVLNISKLGVQFEISNPRKFSSNGSGNLHYSQTSIREDIANRDFTMNSILYEPYSHELSDYIGGMTDIENKIVKLNYGREDILKQDPVRIFRFFRFCKQLNFRPDPISLNIINKSSDLIAKCNPERVRNEIEKMIDYPPNDSYIMYFGGVEDILDKNPNILLTAIPMVNKGHLRRKEVVDVIRRNFNDYFHKIDPEYVLRIMNCIINPCVNL